MDSTDQTTTQTITLTSTAIEAVQGLMEQRNLKDYALRVYVAGGGCSGIQYGMAFDNNIRPEDDITEIQGLKVLVDEVSMRYLQGAIVDYLDGPQGTGFKISNPNVVSSCGCSSSSGDSSGGCQGCG